MADARVQLLCTELGVCQGPAWLRTILSASHMPFANHARPCRLAPGTWVGVHYAWGWDNREVPLRLTCPPARKGEFGSCC